MSGFRDVTGHERTIEHLKNAIASGRVSQAYLLVGDKGMGKKTIAQAFAQTLQCETLER
ncbi:MAG TPA: DNA polymerase III subunit delta, partial [Lachnospiraceae bacterium]|nr:DNA polymerase III subunit delta [Lachnospiraceae bacterium]